MNLRWTLLASTLLLLLASGAAQADRTELISLSTDGDQGIGASGGPAISDGGRFVAFSSEAPNLVPGDTNDSADVFVRDREAETTERVSVSSAGEQANGGTRGSSISDDGRFVAFSSGASNLVPGDTNELQDIFVHDRQMGTTERVSVSSTGSQGNGTVGYGTISADGRFVAFESEASNLVAGDTNEASDVFVHDRQTGVTERVSISSSGEEANQSCTQPAISGDGRFVAFRSLAANLVADDTNEEDDIFLRDRLLSTTELVSLTNEGEQFALGSIRTDITPDGRFVFWRLTGSMTESDNQLFVRDRQEGTTECVSVNDAGYPADAGADESFSASADGRFIAFASIATNLDPRSPERTADIFLRDRLEQTTELISLNNEGEKQDGLAINTAISPDGRFAAFGCDASNIIPNHLNYEESLVLRDLKGFADVSPLHWAAAEIEACLNAGIVSGYPNGTYGPLNPVTRDQMAVFISRSICTPTGEAGMAGYTPPTTPTFPDVATDYWSYKYIEYAAEQNIVGGYPDGFYRPDEPVNRGQMAVFVARAMVTPSGDAAVLPGPPSPTFPDVTSTNDWSWCYDHVEHIAAQGVTQGYFDGYYHPEYTCTRDMMAVYIQRAFHLPM